MAGIAYRNISTKYGLEAPRSKRKKSPKVGENKQAEVLWDFQIHTDKMVMANQPDILVVIKQQKKAVDVDRYGCSNRSSNPK